MKNKAVIYARVSTSSQDDAGTSLDSQVKFCQEFAKANGYEVVEILREVYSGAYLIERPLINKVLQGIRNGSYNAVISYAVDRLSREFAHTIIISNEADRFNCKLLFVTEDFDNSSEGRLLQSVKGYVAEIEREKIRERSLRGKITKAEKGDLSFGHKVYGYDFDSQTKTRTINESEAEIVKSMYERMLSGSSMRSIATTLDLEGIPSPENGKCWGQSTVQRILKNPAYGGMTYAFRYKRKVFKKDGRTISYNVERDKSEWKLQRDTITPPIISLETFEKVQRIIEQNKKQKRRNPKKEMLLRGKIVCGVCGRNYTTNSDSNGYKAYICDSRRSPLTRCGNSSISAKVLDPLIWEKVCDLIKSPLTFVELLKEVAKSQKNESDKTRHNVVGIRKSLEKAKKELSQMVARSATVNDDIWKLMQPHINAKQVEISRLEEVLTNAETVNAKATKFEINLKNIRSFCAAIAKRLPNATFEKKVEILDGFDVTVLWTKGHAQMQIASQQILGNSCDDERKCRS